MDNDINDILLQIILKEIASKGVTEKECTSNVNVSTSFFSDWKAGRLKSPSFDKIYRISKYLDVSIDFLSTGIETPIIPEKTNSLKEKFAADERSLINTYRKLNDDGKTIMLDISKEIWADHPLPIEDSQPKSKSYYYPMSEKNVADAG